MRLRLWDEDERRLVPIAELEARALALESKRA